MFYETMDYVQDSQKGILFDSFPSVLQLQLKRFEFDFSTDVMSKVIFSLYKSVFE